MLDIELKRLIKKDQKSISDYLYGKITKEQWLLISQKISKNFLSLLKKYNFPYRNKTSEFLYKSAVTLSLHLEKKDLERVFLKFIKNSDNEQILNEHKIIFIDKIKVISGKKQIYGSQFKKTKNGKVRFLPIINRKKVNERRKKLGLDTIEKYKKTITLN